jgi:hypothetical protein
MKINGLLSNCITMSTPDNDEIYLFSDASHDGSGVAIACAKAVDQDSPPLLKRKHKPVGFTSGIFKTNQQAWTSTKKELHAVRL